jgi:uncharacterized protein (TIRG00374 family)
LKRVERIAFAAGLVLLAWLIRRIGVETAFRTVARIGWGFAAVLLLYGVVAAVNTLAWRVTLPPADRVSFGRLFGFLLAGDAINAVTPSAVVGGELVRVSLLRRMVPGPVAAASVALAAACQFLAQILFLAAGTPLLAGLWWKGGAKRGLLAFAVLGAGTVLIGIGLAIVRSHDLFARLHGIFRRLFPGRVSEAGEARWRSLDEAIFSAIRRRRKDLVAAAALYLIGWALGAAEIALILFLSGAPAGWRTCLSIEVLSVGLDTVLFFVPARIGTQEGGKYVIFRLLALDPRLGLGVGLVRRLREIVWALPGLVLLGRVQKRPGPEAAAAQISGDRAAIPET